MKDVGHTGLETSQSLPGNLWLLGKYVHSWTGWQVKEGAAPKHCLIAIYSVSTIVKNMMQTGNAEYSPSK